MIRIRSVAATLSWLLVYSTCLHSTCQAGVVDKYRITPEERASCQADAGTLCSTVYPDEDRLIECMKANEARLTPTCAKTFQQGLQRRHLS